MVDEKQSNPHSLKKIFQKMTEKNSCETELKYFKKLDAEILRCGLFSVVCLTIECGWANVARCLVLKHGLKVESLSYNQWKDAFGWSELIQLPDQVLCVLITHLGCKFENLLARLFLSDSDAEERLLYYENMTNQDDSCFFFNLLCKCVQVELGKLSECCRTVFVCDCANKKTFHLSEDQLVELANRIREQQFLEISEMLVQLRRKKTAQLHNLIAPSQSRNLADK